MHSKIIENDNDPLGGILKLQLKKPKNWQWELRTSKSSPHISLPIVKLYDHHGNLLISADDPDGSSYRKSWHSNDKNSRRGKSQPQRSESNPEHSKKYKLRTSKAGTLVIPSNSFQTRRPKYYSEFEEELANASPCETSQNWKSSETKINHFGNFFDDRSLKSYQMPEYRIFNRRNRAKTDLGLSLIIPQNGELNNNECGFIDQTLRGKSGSRVRRKSSRSLTTNSVPQNGCTEERYSGQEPGYIVQEPLTPKDEDEALIFAQLLEKSEIAVKQKRRKRINRTNGDRILEIDKKPVTELEYATKTLQSTPDAVLLRLVRSLATSSPVRDDADAASSPKPALVLNMGANVSRHSGKGLSGRRTQSSGNICNGKAAQPKQHVYSKLLGSCATGTGTGTTGSDAGSGSAKDQRTRLCGSLPNHLDAEIDDDNTTTSCDDDEDTDSISYPKDNNNQNPNAPYQIQPPLIRAYAPKKPQAPPIPTYNGGEIHLPPLANIPKQPQHLNNNNNIIDPVLCDQGYGSERSPEEEFPPALPSEPPPLRHPASIANLTEKYPFIVPDSIFTVILTKNSRGLGLSVSGGTGSGCAWPGLIRVKRLFPNQPAAMCGLLVPGDLLLSVNDLPLTGLTNYEALEMLRTTPSLVMLTVCRPPPEILSVVSPLSDVPPPPPQRRDPPCSLNLLPPIGPSDDIFSGEFDIVMTKIQGSLGFTLRKEDESALGHYVRALVREPALSDGRIKAGDKIVAVNDVELSAFSHEEAVQFLRQCGSEVRLRLYRDAAQTPVAALSPTEPEPPVRNKPLRQEAVDMLSDLAARKMSPSGDDSRKEPRSSMSPPLLNSSSPRRLRRTQRSTPESDGSYLTGSSVKSAMSSQTNPDELSGQPGLGSSDDNMNFSSIDSEPEKPPIRPNFLSLNATSGATSSSSRKPKFQFSLAHNAYELNNLDADVLDAPNFQYALNVNREGDAMDTITGQTRLNDSTSSAPEEPVSMPPISSQGFSYKNPSYQSAHPKCVDSSEPSVEVASVPTTTTDDGSKGLLKWKGVVFTPEGSNEDSTPVNDLSSSYTHLVEKDSNIAILTVELNRGWNSRLGFSLQQGDDGNTYISAVHSDSVAAKDGRLRQGDQLLKVNDEDVEKMSTSNVIDLLRIVRGPVCIIVARRKD